MGVQIENFSVVFIKVFYVYYIISETFEIQELAVFWLYRFQKIDLMGFEICVKYPLKRWFER